jgi:uncharacterized protein (TIGR03435 family)
MHNIVKLVATTLAACWVASGQAPVAASFDVASVKSAAPCCAPGQWRESKVGEDRIDLRYVTLRYCIALAYRLKEYQISGPSWLAEARYDIVAKGPEGTQRDQLPTMLRQLLEERFKLRAHHETKEFNVLAISVGKNGPKLQESPADATAGEGARVAIGMSPNGVGRIEVKHGDMASLANTVTRIVGRPVVDLTGLSARYDFELEYAREDSSNLLVPSADPSIGVSIFASIQRLGLKLEAQKPRLDSIVVDSAEKTFTEN